MNEFLLFAVLFGPYALGLVFLLSLIPTLIKWDKEDSAWEAYYDDFKRNRK